MGELMPMVDRGQLSELVTALGGDAGTLAAADGRMPITLWRIAQSATLLHEGAAARAVWVLRSGSLKCVKILEDGYEQVVCLAQPGELLGFDAMHSGRQPTSAVALQHATAYALSLAELQALRLRCPALDVAFQLAVSRQLSRAAGIAEMMAAVASDVRLARFLLWVSARMEEAGRSPRRLLLHTSRREIASLLGVAHETVSRSFAALADGGLIAVDNRQVDLLDLAGLRARARSTRGCAEGVGRIEPARRAVTCPPLAAPIFPAAGCGLPA